MAKIIGIDLGTKQPSYRVVIADQHAKRDGAFVEVVGHYDPRSKPDVLQVKEDRIRHWLSPRRFR